jgi:hypothetical protein
MLTDHPAATEIENRVDRSADVVLHRDREPRCGTIVYEVGEWQDPFVPDAGGRVEREDSCEVTLLDPELGCVRSLAQQEGNDLVGGHLRPRELHAERPSSEVPSQDVGVVTEAVDGGRAGGDPVLLEAALREAEVGMRERARELMDSDCDPCDPVVA